jgi:hypothetical protein
MHPAWLRCESLKYLDIPAFRALPGWRSTLKNVNLFLCGSNLEPPTTIALLFFSPHLNSNRRLHYQ